MRRLAVVTLVLLIQLQAGVMISARQQPDRIAALLGDFEAALNSGQIEHFIAEATTALPADQRRWLTELAPSAGTTTATVRERGRSATTVLIDVFVAQGTHGFVASWLLTFAPSNSSTAVRLEDIHEVWRFDDLIHVTLDATRQFAVTDLVVRGPDFTIDLPSGVVFMVDAGGPTGLVMLGQATVRFTPSDPAEQGQLRIFGGESALVAETREAFVRLNPDDFTEAVSWTRIDPVAVETPAVSRAQRIFDERAPGGYEIDLGDLTGESWSVRPGGGSLRVGFATRRNGWLTYSHSPGRTEDVSLVDDSRRRQVSSYRSGPESAAAPSASERDPYDVTATDVDVTFDPNRLWLSGRASVTLRMRQPSSSFSLRLATTLVVSSASSPALGRLLSLRPSDRDLLLVGLPVEVPAGETITVDVQYHGRLRPQELDVARPGTAAVDPLTQEPFFFVTTPRFLYSNESGWYPQPVTGQHAPASLRLTVPASYEAVATGERLGEIISHAVAPFGNGERSARTLTYRADRPVRYLSILVAKMEPLGTTRAQVPSTTGGTSPSRAATVDIAVLMGRERTTRVRATPGKVAAIVAFYAALMGGAPYPSLTVAALEDRVPGGHSPAQLVLINQPHAATPLSWARDPVSFPDFPDFFLAHEIAHQWWGQAVAGASYHEQWISEGFAQYLAWCYVTTTEGEDAGRRLMAKMLESTEDLADEGPIALGFRLGHLRGDRRIFRAIVYNKSAVVLHMLRRLIGEDAFIGGLRRVYAQHRFSLITTADVRAAFEPGTTIPLERFFARWIGGTGTPVLSVSWSQPTADLLTVRVTQTGEVFDLPYDATITYTDGSRDVTRLRIISAILEQSIRVRGQIQSVDFSDPTTIATIRD